MCAFLRLHVGRLCALFSVSMWAVRVRHARRFPLHVGRHEFRCGVRHVRRFTSPWRPCQPLRGSSRHERRLGSHEGRHSVCASVRTLMLPLRAARTRVERDGEHARAAVVNAGGLTSPCRSALWHCGPPPHDAQSDETSAIRAKSPPPYGSTSGRVLRNKPFFILPTCHHLVSVLHQNTITHSA